jgi:hypothetical protein
MDPGQVNAAMAVSKDCLALSLWSHPRLSPMRSDSEGEEVAAIALVKLERVSRNPCGAMDHTSTVELNIRALRKTGRNRSSGSGWRVSVWGKKIPLSAAAFACKPLR